MCNNSSEIKSLENQNLFKNDNKSQEIIKTQNKITKNQHYNQETVILKNLRLFLLPFNAFAKDFKITKTSQISKLHFNCLFMWLLEIMGILNSLNGTQAETAFVLKFKWKSLRGNCGLR